MLWASSICVHFSFHFNKIHVSFSRFADLKQTVPLEMVVGLPPCGVDAGYRTATGTFQAYDDQSYSAIAAEYLLNETAFLEASFKSETSRIESNLETIRMSRTFFNSRKRHFQKKWFQTLSVR